jgi:hypothetical protein
MKKLLAAVRRAIASVGSVSWQLVKTVHGWAYNLVRQPPAAEDSLAMADEVVDHADDQDIEKIASSSSGEFQRVRNLLAAIEGSYVDYQHFQGLSDLHIDWATALTPQMRAMVAKASDQQIADHVHGRRIIPGLLSCDANAVAAFKRVPPKPDNDGQDYEFKLAIAA